VKIDSGHITELFTDDKNLVIIAVTIIALANTLSNPEIIPYIVTGLFGVATGRATKP